MAYTTIDDPSEYFHTQLYTGDGNDDRSITNDANAGDFKPDWLWIKNRSSTNGHALVDSTRGATKVIRSQATNAEETESNGIQAFETDGFQIGTSGLVNTNGNNYVAWQWKANGGTTSSNSSGDITSTNQILTTSGFGILTYTGFGEAVKTLGHNLGSIPDMMIFKSRSSSGGWFVYHKDVGNGKYLNLHSSDAATTDSNFFNNTTPTSSLITLGTSSAANGASVTYVCYLFKSIQGYSKIGSYKANGNVDGPFVYTGFKPAWVMFKQTNSSDTAHWFIYDSTRSPTNVIGDVGLAPNLSNAEGLGSTWNPNTSNSVVDFVSNGFKIRTTATSGFNINGNTMIYMAFAEHPFVSSKGVPVTAR